MRLFPRRRLFLGAVLALWLGSGAPFSAVAAEAGTLLAELRPPRLFPDYSGITLPPNIAPLNFKVEEPGAHYRVTLRSVKGDPIVISSRSASIKIPPKPWRTLLRANAGEPLYIEVSVRDRQTEWSRFGPVTNFVAREEIDGTLVYRLLKPLYNVFVNLGIYQRDLQTFDQWPVLQNRKFGGDCLNCHTFLNHRPESFAFHIRTTTNVHPMILVCSNEAVRVDKTMGYLSWHPSGRLLAFSANKLSMFCHTLGETRDVFDAQSDLRIYRVDSNRVVAPPSIALPDRNETWPGWSPDGRYLYYCSAPVLPVEQFRQVRYDLVRVSYDLERDQWGTAEVLVPARDTGLSAGQPKVSPDNQFVLFCLYNYGNFPVYQPSSDLYVFDLSSRQYRRLDLNSSQADSWHCWSSNSRWVVFSSKRLDGLFTRPFFSYVDIQGRFHKPFLLPQKDPAFYDTYLENFNVPELVQGPVEIKDNELARTVTKPAKTLVPTSDAPQTPPGSKPGQETEGSRLNYP